MKLKKYDIVQIKWEDACSKGRCNPEDIKEHLNLAPCISCGFFIQQDKKKISIAQSQFKDGFLMECITIPLKWIQEIKKIK